MPKQETALRYLATLVLCTLGCLCVLAGPGADNKDAPKPLPPKIVKAWTDAEAIVGWMRVYSSGYLEFRITKDSIAGDVPAFRLNSWQQNTLAKLPDPGTPFGLDFRGTEMMDAGMKELAAQKSVKSLWLDGTKVTDAGLKELAGLKLRSLSIPSSARTDLGLKHCLAALEPPTSLILYDWNLLTDAGLKELAELKSLQSLDLRKTQVTDAGLKELAGLKTLKYLRLESTQVTEAGVARLQKDLPGCKISWGP